MSEVTKAVERIRKFLRGRPNLSLGGFAKSAGLHRNTLYGLHDDSWNPPVSTLNACLLAVDKIEREEARSRKRRTPKLGAVAPAA